MDLRRGGRVAFLNRWSYVQFVSGAPTFSPSTTQTSAISGFPFLSSTERSVKVPVRVALVFGSAFARGGSDYQASKQGTLCPSSLRGSLARLEPHPHNYRPVVCRIAQPWFDRSREGGGLRTRADYRSVTVFDFLQHRGYGFLS
jgi:hypothetical protein